MSAKDWIMLGVLSMVWGAAFFFYKVLVGQIAPFSLVFGTLAISLVLLLALVAVRGQSLPRDRTAWQGFFVMGALNCVLPYSLISWSESQIPSGLASIINATTPMFTVIVAHFSTADERITANRLVGIVLGIIGVGFLMGPRALTSINLTSLAQLGCIAASICYAFAAVYGRRFRSLGLSPLVASTGQIAGATALCAPLVLVFDKPWLHPPALSTAGWTALLGIAILSTVFAYVLYFRVLASAGATNVLLVTLLTPASALLLGSIVLKEHIALTSFVGLLLILAGLVAIDGRLRVLRS
jgi:drug/metabolite transporter (DMT)-like permease